MTVQSTFITTDNVQDWRLIEHTEQGGIIGHSLIAWKLRGIDAPAIPITVSGGPRIITNETVWFLFNTKTNIFYGMDESGCWYKHQLPDDELESIAAIQKHALSVCKPTNPIFE